MPALQNSQTNDLFTVPLPDAEAAGKRTSSTGATRFRANPVYRLVPAANVSAPERHAARGGVPQGGPHGNHGNELYGYFIPTENDALPILPAGCADALLFYSLHSPGSLPWHLQYTVREGAADPHTLAWVTRRVLDGILEIEGTEGFISGLRALRYLRPQRGDSGNPETVTGRLSQEALLYAAGLSGIPDAEALSSRLYHFNTLPVSPSWRRRLSDPEQLDAFLGRERFEAMPGWRHEPAKGREWWHFWSHARQAPRSFDVNRLPYYCKLYLSPLPDALPEAFPAAMEILRDSRANAMKIGANIYGLLRPDKMVAYFDSMDDLRETCAALKEALCGVPAQGVPFTADFSGDGLISWGADPDQDAISVENIEGCSWRQWVTRHLATALVELENDPTAVSRECDIREQRQERCRLAMDRIALSGVDPETWAPMDLAAHWKDGVIRG